MACKGVLTIQGFAEYGSKVFKDAVGSPALYNPSGSVKRGKVALEGNVAGLHVDACSHALKSPSASVVPASQNTSGPQS